MSVKSRLDFLTKYFLTIPSLRANCKQANQSAIQPNLSDIQANWKDIQANCSADVHSD